MKSLVAAVALAAVVATPALAQTASRRAPAQPQYNESYGRTDGQRHSAVPNNDVYESGHYVGSDPDPNVRLEMQRDNHQGD
jgi:Ni/Co efflux regulator RcnB